MSPRILQCGHGVSRDVVVFYGLSDLDHVRRFLWPEACALADWRGPYAIVGPDDVEPLGHVVSRARREAGPFRVRAVVLVGFGPGCRAVREQIREGARPDVIVALDGFSGPPGPIPPDEYHLGPWRVIADRARRSECLAVFTHTAENYMELLPPGQRYASALTVLREVTELPLPTLSLADPPAETRDGGLVVRSFPSRTLDRVAQNAQRTVALPRIVAELVRPWLDEMDFTPTSLPRWQV